MSNGNMRKITFPLCAWCGEDLKPRERFIKRVKVGKEFFLIGWHKQNCIGKDPLTTEWEIPVDEILKRGPGRVIRNSRGRRKIRAEFWPAEDVENFT